MVPNINRHERGPIFLPEIPRKNKDRENFGSKAV